MIFRVGLFGFVGALVALIIAVLVTMASLPAFNSLMQKPNGQTVRVHAADGSLLVSLGPSYGDWLPYDRIPPVMRDAIVSVEDRRFYSHFGIDPVGMARMIYVAKRLHDNGRRLQGASTITQQLARNLFLTQAYNVGRKFREIILALAMERKYSKQQILELYLNRMYFGGGAYGIDAASRKFFGHPADHMSLAEAAIVAGLLKAPSHYSPSADAQAARDRANVVLEVMVDAGAITPAQKDGVHLERVVFAPEPKQNSVRYFTDWALAQLDTIVDEQSAPLDVWTTLDLRMQQAADNAIRQNTPAGAQGALVSMENDGAVRAMVGGTDYVTSIYNRATQAVRQPGSSFKLFVYLTALESGMKPTDTIVDEPVTIGGWTPRNSSRTNLGPVTLREAFSRSINTISAKIGSQLGFGTIADMARRFGITTPISTYPSMVLGTSDVRLLDMTKAFAAVENKGVAVTPYAIRKVVTADGRLLYQHESSDERVLVAPWVAAEMTDLLQSAVLSGTGRAAQIGRPVAGKTGTTTSNKDGWFIGFSSGLTTGVWMGRDDARTIPGLQGGTAPARAFHDFMAVAVANRPIEQFETQVPMPDWQLTPEEEVYGDTELDANAMQPFVDANGNPISQPLPPQSDAPPSLVRPDGTGAPTQEDLDRAFPPAQPQPGQRLPQPPPRQQDPNSTPPPEPTEPRPYGA